MFSLVCVVWLGYSFSLRTLLLQTSFGGRYDTTQMADFLDYRGYTSMMETMFSTFNMGLYANFAEMPMKSLCRSK